MQSGAQPTARTTDRFERELGEAVTSWGITPRVALALFLIPLVGGVAVVAARVSGPLFEFLTDEDHLLEWMQVAFYAAAAVFGFFNAVRLWRSGDRMPSLAWFAFTLGCVFVTGEEISWGQRIFGWATPESFRHINRQAETTLHNIRTVLNGVNAVLLVGGLYGMVAWYGVRRLRETGRTLDRDWLFVPPFFLASAFGVVFAYKLSRLTVFTSSQFTIVRIGEWAELCFAFGLSAFAVLVFARLRRERSSS